MQISPKQNEYESIDHFRLEISELIQLNNSLNEKIERLTDENQTLEREYQNERLLFQQRLDDLKTKNLMTNEECRALREEIHKLKKELKEMYSRQEQNQAHNITESVLQQQLNTYKQLSESLTRENVKLTTDIARLSNESYDRESEEKKTTSSIKLLLEKISQLESELNVQHESYENEKQFKQQILSERDELNGKLHEVSNKYKRVETELRTLQSRVQEEVQNEVSIEIERLYVLEEECNRLQKEIFNTRNERNSFELENLRLNQELIDLQNLMENNSSENQNQMITKLQLEIDELNKRLTTSNDQTIQLQNLIEQKDVELDAIRSQLTSETERYKIELKDLKKNSKLNLQQAEGKLSKMQAEILRLVSRTFICIFTFDQ